MGTQTVSTLESDGAPPRSPYGGSIDAPEHFCPQCQALRRAADPHCVDCHASPPAQGWPPLEGCSDPWLGKVTHGYLLDRRIGEGSVGVIYRAASRKLSRSFALKVVDLTSENVVDTTRVSALHNLRREIEAQSSLKNPHVVHLFDVLELGDHHIGIVMDLVEGRTVGDLVGVHGPLPVVRALRILRQACIGVHEAHEAGLIHRDLKPQNLMVEPLPSGEDFTRVFDFGIVCLQKDAGAMLNFVGTPAYASPEQAACEPLDRRSDIYSLGAVLFFMLTGRPPFGGETIADVLTAHMRHKPMRLSEAHPQASFDDALEDLVARLLAKNPRERPRTLSQLISEIDALLDVMARRSIRADSHTLAERSHADTVEIEDDPLDGVDPVFPDTAAADAVPHFGDIIRALGTNSVREVDVPSAVVDRPRALTGDDRLIYLHEAGELKLVDATLATEWAIDLRLEGCPCAITLADDAAFIATSHGQLHEFSLSFNHRKLLWTDPQGACVKSVSCDEAARRIALVSGAGEVLVADRGEDAAYTWHPLPIGTPAQAVRMSPSGQRVGIHTDSTRIEVWTLTAPREQICTVCVPSGADSMALTSDGRHLVCSTRLGHCGLLSLPDGVWTTVTGAVDDLVGIDVDREGALIMYRDRG